MGKIVVIAEKPSVGRDIAKTLNATAKGDGYLYSDTHIVTWAIGHLVTLCDPEDYDGSLKKWRLDTLPIIPPEIKLKAVTNTKKQLEIIKKLMNDKDTDEIICATDSGREGELIFRYIYLYVNCKKPFKRLWISSMTDTAIKNGFKNLKDGADYDNLYLSAKCRSEADWLVGINATRLFTIRYNCLLSVGRVQTPTLAIIVSKQKEIDAFKPRDYFEIKAVFECGSELYNGTWFDPESNDTKIFDKEKAESTGKKVLDKSGHVKAVENTEKKQPPPLLYDLTELQRDANKKYGFTAKKTLSIAQDLYEKRKLITYPRTDSRYLSEDMSPKLRPTLENLSLYDQLVKKILANEKLPITKRIIDNGKVSDHHAIIPTEKKQGTLTPEEMKIYDLIVKRFIAVFLPYYIYNITKITTLVENENFMTKGTTVTQYGWMELYKDTGKKEGEEEILPAVKLNESVFVRQSEVIKKRTEPPKPYSEATLLSAMENAGRFVEDEALKEQLKESGIGTPATRASIIERLLEVGYIVRKGKAVYPTDKGMKLIEVAPEELISPETTGKWEKGLSSVSKGKMEHVKFMRSIERYVNYIVSASPKAGVVFPADAKRASKFKPAKTFGKCPNCEAGAILENTKAYYCSEWKNGCSTTIWKDRLNGGELTEEILLKHKLK